MNKGQTMKSRMITLVTIIAALMTVQTAIAQERGNQEPRVSPNAAVSQTIGTTEVDVTYGRPSVNHRTIFGGLVPWDEVWRTGANEATTITFSDDVMIEGETLEAGTYGLFTLPTEMGWSVIFNTPEQWGAFDYDETQDALRVDVSPEESFYIEQMIIYFENIQENSGNLVIHWDETKVPVRIETP